jgi:hypothetical protein
MSEELTPCPCADGLVVMLAVTCTHCGIVHRAGYRVAHDAGDPHPQDERVWDTTPAAEPAALTSARPALGAARPVRTETTYVHRPRPPREKADAWRPRPRPKRPPLAQAIQDVIDRSRPRDLDPGTRVVVRNHFNGRWTPGFVVHEVTGAGYRIRRDHGGAPDVLPTVFHRRDVAVDRPHRNASAASRDGQGLRRTPTLEG